MPVLELTFQNVAGSPWEGEATVRLSGEAYGPFAVREGMTAKQRDDVRWYVEQFMDYPEGGHEKRARQIEQQLNDYGLALWSGLDEQAPVLQQWLGAVQATGSGRLELRANSPQDEVAFRSPWELMRVGGNSERGGTLLHQLGVSVVRRVKANLPAVKPLDTSGGLRVLAIVCRPDEEGFLDPRYTPEAILDALVKRPEVSVDFCRPGTLATLVDALDKAKDEGRPYHVVHFDGHGTTIPSEAGIGALCFEQESGQLDLVRADQFGDLMSGNNIPLVVLEACRTATKTFARETVAGALLRHGVGSVVAMGYAVHVDMTRELMSSFYGKLAAGRTLGQSLQAARKHIHATKHRRTRIAADAPTVELQDWFAPQLYQAGEDVELLPKKVSRRKKPAAPMFVGFPPPPRAGFQGRGRELHKLERLLTRERAVVVHAPGGMGKTAISREAAHWWLRTGMFPDGAIFVSLEGNPSANRVIVQVGEALEGTDFHKRSDTDRRAYLLDELSKRRMLIVWDNFESVLPHFNVGQASPLAKPPTDTSEDACATFAELAAEWTAGQTRLLVTCRDAQPRLDSGSLTCRPFALGELNKVEGLMLLVGYLDRLGFDRAEREKKGWTAEALEPIVVKTLGHPLSLELLAPHVVRLGAEAVARELPDILSTAEQDHDEARNRSIRQSLDFSIRHLSDEARAALPAVALLSGGCLENMAAMIVGLEEKAWSKVRGELERTGLVRVEDGFLRPHPVLDVSSFNPEPIGDGVADVVAGSPDPATDVTAGLPKPEEDASVPGDLRSGDVGGSETRPQHEQTRPQHEPFGLNDELLARFFDVVAAFCGEFNKLVRTPQARLALGVMAGSEVVVRRAIDLTAAAGRVEHAVAMAGGMQVFLQFSGRGGEGAALMTALQAAVASGGRQPTDPTDPEANASGSRSLTRATAQLAIDAAWARARQDAAGAASELNRLLEKLATVNTWDTRFKRATVLMHLARIRCDFDHRPAKAIEPLQQAAALFEELESVGQIDSSNRAAALGGLANPLMDLARYDEALDAAERSLALDRDRNDQTAAARGLGQIAQILQQQGRYDQAEARYREALEPAQDGGDDEATGIIWQSLGNMNLDRNRPDEAARALRQALDAFARAGNAHGQMQVLNSLGAVERRRGNAEAALAWYERSLELAQQLGDVQGQATTRGNRAVLLSAQAEAATDPQSRQRLLKQVISEEREVLVLNEQKGNPAEIAIGHNNLANSLRLAGQLDKAEQHARAALDLRQQLNDPNTWQTLLLLEKIAEARGDAASAAEWRAAKEAASAEAQDRAGEPGLPSDTIIALLQLALTARQHKIALPDALRSAGADDSLLPAIGENDPWLTTHLEALAAGQPRPAVDVPARHKDVIDAVWEAAGS